MSPSKSGLVKAIAKRLRVSKVFRSSYVDEHAVLFQHEHSMIEQMRKNISLQACWGLRDVLKNSATENVYATIYEARGIVAGLLLKSGHSAAGSRPHGSVTGRISCSPPGDAD